FCVDSLNRWLRNKRRCIVTAKRIVVKKQLTLSYDRHRLTLTRNDVTEAIVGRYVDIYDFADGQLEANLPSRLSFPIEDLCFTFDCDLSLREASKVGCYRPSPTLADITTNDGSPDVIARSEPQ